MQLKISKTDFIGRPLTQKEINTTLKRDISKANLCILGFSEKASEDADLLVAQTKQYHNLLNSKLSRINSRIDAIENQVVLNDFIGRYVRSPLSNILIDEVNDSFISFRDISVSYNGVMFESYDSIRLSTNHLAATAVRTPSLYTGDILEKISVPSLPLYSCMIPVLFAHKDEHEIIPLLLDDIISSSYLHITDSSVYMKDGIVKHNAHKHNPYSVSINDANSSEDLLKRLTLLPDVVLLNDVITLIRGDSARLQTNVYSGIAFGAGKIVLGADMERGYFVRELF